MRVLGSVTGRVVYEGPELQNVKLMDKSERIELEAKKPLPAKVLSFDYSAIELRLLAKLGMEDFLG